MIFAGGMKIEQGKFPDNTLLMKIDPNSTYFEPHDSCLIEWYYENDSELFALICVKRHLDHCFPSCRFQLYMPYIPHARMDRVKSDADVFTLKYFCEVINSLHFDDVHVYDAHSNVSLALLNNVVEDHISPCINCAIKKSGVDALFYPDEGAMKRYSSNSTLPYAFGMKARDWETGKIIGYDVVHSDNINGKNVLIVDDICSRGGTFYYAAKALKEAGAKNIYLYVTHCENTILEGDLLTSGLIEKVYTINSIFTKEHEMIEVFEL